VKFVITWVATAPFDKTWHRFDDDDDNDNNNNNNNNNMGLNKTNGNIRTGFT
jgi:hypothetical protein